MATLKIAYITLKKLQFKFVHHPCRVQHVAKKSIYMRTQNDHMTTYKLAVPALECCTSMMMEMVISSLENEQSAYKTDCERLVD